ncbi:MAG: histidine--tRNA ligase [Bacteroidia bacterium]|nr:histidine--tRNA ligase [Bacteroidia bacterium]
MAKRNFIIDVIRSVYNSYGYRQIETPAMENLATLEGKYGDEGDQLLFRILNSGLKNVQHSVKISDIAEKGLRYDLTVPFARYVVMHRHEIMFPFKRFQIQPVWRADRPQKGRYREFVQCDADVIGSDSLLNEVEMVLMINEVFAQFGFKIKLLVNNRKILSAIAEAIDQPDKITDLTVALDKLDKTGTDKVVDELTSKGFSPGSVQKLLPLFKVDESLNSKIHFLNSFLSGSETGRKGIEEIETLFRTLAELGVSSELLKLELTLARGLNYYTGAIFEVKLNDPRSAFPGSLLGGGRYDDLTGIFGLPSVSGVGISFGIDRIYDVMEELNLFDQIPYTTSSTQVLFVNFGEKEACHCLQLLSHIRKKGVHAELYPDPAKMKKQIGYADANRIPYVVLIGSEEIQSGLLTVKTMLTGVQEKLSLDDFIKRLTE